MTPWTMRCLFAASIAVSVAVGALASLAFFGGSLAAAWLVSAVLGGLAFGNHQAAVRRAQR